MNPSPAAARKPDPSSTHRPASWRLRWLLAGFPLSALLALGAGVPGTVAWKLERPGTSWGTAAVGGDGSIYAVTVPAGTGPATLNCVGADGSVRWSHALASRDFMEPIVAPDGSVLVAATTGTVLSFSPDGVVRGKAVLGLERMTGMAVAKDGSVHLAGFAPVELPTEVILKSDASVMVRVPFAEFGARGGMPIARQPPQIGSDGMVIFVTGFTNGWVPGAGGVSNAILLHVPFASIAPALGSFDRFAVPESRGLSLRHADGQEFARLDGPAFVSGAVIAGDGTLYCGSESNRLHAVSPTGIERWTWDAGAPVRSTPLILANGGVVGASATGRLFALDTQGGLLWETDLGGPVTAHLNALPDGRIIAGGGGGTLWCVESGSTLALEGWPKWQSDPSNSGRNQAPPVSLASPGNLDVADRVGIRMDWESVPGARAYEIWKDSKPLLTDSSLLRVSAEPSATDFEVRHLEQYTYRVRAFNGVATGPFSGDASVTARRLLWSHRLSGSKAYGPAMLSDGALVVAVAGPQSGELVVVNPDGSERWRRPLPYRPFGVPLVTGADSIWISTGQFLSRFASDGSTAAPLQLRPTPAYPDMIGVGQEGVIYALQKTNSEWRVIGLDPVTGDLRAQGQLYRNLQNGALARIVVGRDGSVLVLDESRLTCLNPNLSKRWHRGGGPVDAAVFSDGDYLVAATIGLRRISPQGEVRWTNSTVRSPDAFSRGDDVGTPGLAIASDDTAYVATGNALWSIASDGTLRWRVPLPTGSRISRPAPLLDDQDGVHILADRQVLTLDASGGVISRLALPGPGSYWDAPLLDRDGHLHVLFESGLLVSADLGHAASTTAPWPLPRRDARNTSSAADAPELPAPVSNLEAIPFGAVQRVRWLPSGMLVYQEIFRSNTPDFTQARQLARLDASTDHFDDTEAGPGLRNHYWVVTSNSAGVATPVTTVSGAGMTPQVRARIILPDLESGPWVVPVIRPDGTLVTATANGILQAFDPDGSALWTNRIPASQASQLLQVLSENDGRLIVRADTGLFRLSADGTTRVKLRSATGVVSMDADGSFRYPSGIKAQVLDAAGVVVGSTTIPVGSQMLSLVRADQASYLFGPGRSIRALDRSLALLWEKTPESVGTSLDRPFSIPAIGLDGSLFVAPGNRTIVSLDADGNIRWERPVGGDTDGSNPAILGPFDRTLFIGLHAVEDGRRTLFAVNASDGADRWRFPISAEASSSPMVPPAVTEDNTVLVASGSVLWGLDGTTGRTLWGFQAAGPVGTPVIHDDGRIVFTAGQEVVVLRGASPPAFSGWPMWGNNAQGTFGQGSRGVRSLIARGGAVRPGRFSIQAPDGRGFLPLATVDLQRWSPVAGSFDPVPDGHGATHLMFTPTVEREHHFFRALAP